MHALKTKLIIDNMTVPQNDVMKTRLAEMIR
jgi:hypothetical protein